MRPASVTTLASAGHSANLVAHRGYHVEVVVAAATATLSGDDVVVLTATLRQSLAGQQVGVMALGDGGVEFRDLRCVTARPAAFVVMQFGEPFDSLYSAVIGPVSSRCGFAVNRRVRWMLSPTSKRVASHAWCGTPELHGLFASHSTAVSRLQRGQLDPAVQRFAS